ncbi:MAG TPA: hypothetical protein VFA94_07400 [Acidimicrobiales bacterium]|nr:hypothetical protein [Acidimicrobiales bacterium]
MSHAPTFPAVSRRQFIAGGSLLVAATYVLGPNQVLSRPNPFAALLAKAGPRISSGYILGSAGLRPAELRSLIGSGGAQVVPAASLRSGDHRLAGKLARVGIHGPAAGPRAELDPSVTGVQLDVLFPSPDPKAEPGTLLPFYAWTQLTGHNPTRSSTSAIGVNVAQGAALAFALRVRKDGVVTEAPQDAVAVFTSGRESALPKLREGAYLLGLEPTAWERPTTLPPGGGAAPTGSLLVSVGRFE